MEILHDYDGCHVVTQLAFSVATPRFQSLSFTLLSMFEPIKSAGLPDHEQSS